MLATGKYLGLFEGDSLLAIAGAHAYSETYGVAALGNIATRPEARGRGLGATVTAALCAELVPTAPVLGLHVEANNAAALRCYAKVGFEFHAEYEEWISHRL